MTRAETTTASKSPRKRGRPRNRYGSAQAITIRLYAGELRALDAYVAASPTQGPRSSHAAVIIVQALVNAGRLPRDHDPERVDDAHDL